MSGTAAVIRDHDLIAPSGLLDLIADPVQSVDSKDDGVKFTMSVSGSPLTFGKLEANNDIVISGKSDGADKCWRDTKSTQRDTGGTLGKEERG